MKHFSRIIALLLCIALIASVAVCSVVSAAAEPADEVEIAETGATNGIVLHVEGKKGDSTFTPYVYYWNAKPSDKEVAYPGAAMTKDSALKGGKWYTIRLDNITKINFLVTNGKTGLSDQMSDEQTIQAAGEYWFSNDRLRTKNPYEVDPYDSVDMREDTIYFVITTRFYDGDKGNNVHCWDDKKAGNPDTDPAWRGDFKGLADRLDYIKALGFSAIWITPVVENASGYDYHGYHAMNFSKVDARYESSNFTYEDLINAAHNKGMKIVQDVVWNHTGNFGETNLEPLFTKVYNKVTDLADMKATMVPTKKLMDYCGISSPEQYWTLPDAAQYGKRLAIMKQTEGLTDMVSRDAVCDSKNYYHNGYFGNFNWDNYTNKYSQIAGDCVDLNTENKAVDDYIVNAYSTYLDMKVDAFRVDTVRHIPRLSLNAWINDRINQAAKNAGNQNFYMFGEICCRYSQIWYRDAASESVQFYTWDDNASWLGKYKTGTDPDSVKANLQTSIEHCESYVSCSNQPTSNNAFLNGINYHTPDYSKSSGMGAIDFTMHWLFDSAGGAFGVAKAEDQYFNDSTWNVTYVDSHDYAPDQNQSVRFVGGQSTWAENLNLMFTFRGIPCLYYGSEVEFQKGCVIDNGPNCPLSTTGRAYFGDKLEGSVTASDFSKYTASGTVSNTLNSPLAKHLQKLNAIRRAVPALQKGQYTCDGSHVSGDMAYIRRYTGGGVDSLACVAVSGGATFKGIPNGTYIDAVSGDVKQVSGGTLSVPATGQGNMRVYVCCASGFKGISGKIGPDGQTYLK